MFDSFRAGVVAMLATVALPTAALSQSAVPKALGILPADSSIIMCVDMNAFANPKSLFSMVPRQEISSDLFAPDAFGKKKECGDTLSAMVLVAFNPANNERIDALALGLRGISPDGTPTEEFGVIRGRFAKAEGLAMLKGFKIKAGPGTAGIFPSEEGSKPIYVTVPSDDVMLMSTTVSWFATAENLATTKTGLFEPTSNFMTTLGAFKGRKPDAFMHWDGESILGMIGGSSSAGQPMFAPLLAAKGHTLGVFADEVPTLEVHSTFADPKEVASFKGGIDLFVQAQASRFEQQIPKAKTPKRKAAYEEQLKFYKGLTVEAVGPVGVVRHKFSPPPSKEQAKGWALQGLGTVLGSGEDEAKKPASPPGR